MPAKRVTMRQIAERAGTSRTTVSFVLNDVPGINISPETRQRILEIARQLHYIPDSTAQSLARGTSQTIALVLRQSSHQVISDAFLAPVVQGIATAVKDLGYHVLIEPLDPSHSLHEIGNIVRSRRADGILLSGPRTDDRDLLLGLHRENIPLVLMGQLPGTDLPYVDVDNVHGARLAVSHLTEQGCRRIACITNAPLSYTASRDRLEGYAHVLEAAGIGYDEVLVRYGDFTDESGEAAMRSLLEAPGPPPQAVFVASDVVALGALSALKEAGLRVPQDMALVGFDDIPLAAYIDPPLTTVRLPAYALGWAAGKTLTRLILGPEELKDSRVLLDTELVIRQSSALPAAGEPAG